MAKLFIAFQTFCEFTIEMSLFSDDVSYHPIDLQRLNVCHNSSAFVKFLPHLITLFQANGYETNK